MATVRLCDHCGKQIPDERVLCDPMPITILSDATGSVDFCAKACAAAWLTNAEI